MVQNSAIESLEQKDERSLDEDRLEPTALRNLDDIVQELEEKAKEPPNLA